MSKTQQILGGEGYEKYRQYTLAKESAGNYGVENRFGFMGGYQMGVPALKGAGLIKKDAPNDNFAANNPANWNDPPGSKQAFLNNPAIQDRAFAAYTDNNLRTLSTGSNAVVNANTPPEQVAGYLGAAHLVGAGAVKADPTMSKRDGNGVSALSRYQGASGAVSGKTPIPPTVPAKPGAAPKKEDAKPGQVYTGEGASLKQSSFGSDVVITYRRPPQIDIPLPMENPLSKFASFNSIFTLASLSPQQVNFPEDSYRQGRVTNIVLRSGGAGDAVPSLEATTDDNRSGKYEFFIEDMSYELIMTHNRQTKGSNATTFDFTVVEPYSMGLFFQALEIAAVENGYKTGYIGTPYLLMVEFIGFDDNGKAEKIPNTTRYFPIRILGAEMSVTASGAKYKVSAMAWNETAMADSANLFKSDVGVSGGTVQEILQSGEFSLQTVLNKRLQELAAKESSGTLPDEIVIVFPKDMSQSSSTPQQNANPSGFVGASAEGNEGEEEARQNMDNDRQSGATVDPQEPPDMTGQIETRLTASRGANNIRTQSKTSLNEIGSSTMDFKPSQSGESTPVKPDDATPDPNKPPVRKNVRWDATKRQFIFSQGTTIINAISNIVTASKYCKDVKDVEPDALGMVPWFRIESEVYVNPSQAGNVGNQKLPFLLIYKVVPYLVHHSIFGDGKNQSKGVAELKKEAAKEYDFIYSGKNTEVLNFDLNFNAAFLAVSTADRGKLPDMANLAGVGAAALPDTAPEVVNNDPGEVEPRGMVMAPGQELSYKSNSGGTGAVDHRTIVAEYFQKALLDSPADLITGDLTILGDPYYIADSGIGNFSNTGSGRFNITSSYAIDYQSGQPMIIVNFRTPIDYGSNGVMSFGESTLIEHFSGLYFVDTVKNDFQKGKFTQVLSLRRLRNPVTSPQPDPAVAARASGSEAVRAEDGSLSTSRRNTETGELYDASGLYDDKGRATWDPNDPAKNTKLERSRTVTTTRPLVDSAPPEQTFNPEYPFP